ncbi:MAG: hypothetical protein AAGJ83_04090 [Planctomycetota bacterium]
MHLKTCRLGWMTCFCWVASSLVAADVSADDFRVAVRIVEVMEDGSEKTIDRRLHLFFGAKAYDFSLLAPQDVAVVDPAGTSVTLISREKTVTHRIGTVNLVEIAGRLKAYARTNDKKDKLGIDAPIRERPIDSESTEYRTAFADVVYITDANKPVEASQALRFAEFTEWLARVNLYREMGSPPFARMALANKMGTDGLVPSCVTLRLSSRQFKTYYEFSTEFTEMDRKRLDEVAGMVALYRNVSAAEFPR